MANTRQLVSRRKAIRNIRKITRTMELIATARFKQAMDRATEAEPYTRKIAELAADLSAAATNVSHPLLEKRDGGQDSAAAGDLLQSRPVRRLQRRHLREANGRLRQLRERGRAAAPGAVGQAAIAFFRYQGVAAEQTYTQFEDKPRFDEVEELADRYIADFIAGKIDRVEVAYMKFLNAARQVPVVETLLPLSTAAPRRADAASRRQRSQQPVEYEFLPAPRRSWRSSCRCRSRCGCSSASSTRRSASRSPAA